MAENINGWQYEERKLQETLGHTQKEFFENAVICNTNILNFVHGIQKGQWLPDAYQKLKKKNPEIDFDFRPVLKHTVSWQLRQIFSSVGKNLSTENRRRIKAFLGKFGVKFTTNY